MPPDRPVILVAASGGGSRASLFTSLVLEELSRHEIPYDSLRPSGSDFDVEPPPYRPADQILLISSVSGGSLASACYLSTPYRTHEATVTESWRSRWLPKLPEGHVLPLRNSVRTELLGHTLSSLERMRCRDARHYQREVATVEDDIVVKDFLIEAQTQLKEEGEASWIFECPLADHMCTDFMAPLLRGTLHPGLDRGEHVRAFWESELCLDTTNVDWNTVHSANSPAPPPVLLCNATDVKTGRRMIIGFPPLPEDFFTPHKLLAHEQTRLNQVRSWRDATRTCKTAGSVRKITLADAVRISANFPWGFPIARVSGTDLRLIDGGVCDNTGLDSISYVLEALSHWSKLDRIENGKLSKQDESRSRKAKTIIDRLKERGVILLEIDSGAKPQEPSFIAQQLSGLLEPVRAMQNANFANALASVETHSNAIESSLPSEESRMLTEKLSHLVARFNEETKLQSNQRVLRLSAGELRNVRRLTITCNHQDNVITTWALGPSDKGEVLARFLAGSTKLRYDLKESLHACRIERIVLDTLSNQVDELAKSFSNLKPEQLKNDLTQAVDRRNRFVEMSVQVEDLEMARTAEQKAAFEGVALQVSGSDSTADSQMDQIQEPLHTVLKTRAITLQKERMSLFNSALDAVPAVDKKTKVIQLKKGEPSPKITPETPGENR